MIRDSFLYKFGMGEVPWGDKPIHYYVVIAQDTLDSAQLMHLTDELRKAIPTLGPGSQSWKAPFIAECAIFNLKTWNAAFPHLQAHRKSAQQSEQQSE